MDFKPYVDLLAALLTPMIGVTTTWVAVQQYRLAKERMRRELLDRRLVIYRGVMEVLSAVLTYGQVRGEELTTWARVTAEKAFLLDRDLCDHLDLIRKRLVGTWALKLQLDKGGGLPVGEERTRVAGEMMEGVAWLGEQLTKVQERFAKHLRVT